jgi:hypothetical protein
MSSGALLLYIAYSSGIPRPVVLAGPQKHIAMVSPGEIGCGVYFLPWRDLGVGGRQMAKQMIVRKM